jgi:hypothetical protein
MTIREMPPRPERNSQALPIPAPREPPVLTGQVHGRELGWVALRDALGILLVIEAKDDERFERSAVRWAGRLALEVPDLALAELAGVLESLHALPDEHAQRTLLAMAERAVRPRPPASPPPAAARRSQRRGGRFP